jgi:hypothetical protein
MMGKVMAFLVGGVLGSVVTVVVLVQRATR